MQNAKSLNIFNYLYGPGVPGVPGIPRELGYPRWPRAPRAFRAASECPRELQGRDLCPGLPDRPGEPWVGVRILPMYAETEVLAEED